MSEGRLDWLRERGEGEGEVTAVELFFDLVYVLAITQLTQFLREHLSLRGAVETLVLLLAVWLGWIHTAWTTNYFDMRPRPVRFMLIGLMLAGLIMSAALPEAFGARGLVFASAFLVILFGGTALLLAGMGRRHRLRAVLLRVLIWWSASGVLWLAGGLTHGDLRLALWFTAVVLAYGVMLAGFPVPGLGRSHTTDYTIEGEHMAERCRLFVILALGESILVTGANFGQLPSSAATVATFVVGFAGSVTLWWIYFDRLEEDGRQVIATASDPGRLGLWAYTYFHIPIVAGIILVAAADGLTIAHPNDKATVAATALILGGPALYLAGHALFKWVMWRHVRRSRLVALAALVALGPPAARSSILGASIAAMLVLVTLALWDLRDERRPSAAGRPSPVPVQRQGESRP
jgi:low temperature requirement protein LtrA